MASTQDQVAGHWALAVHWGRGRSSGWHTPRSQRSAGFAQVPPSIGGAAQRWWQKPLMQTPSCGQEDEYTQAAPGCWLG